MVIVALIIIAGNGFRAPSSHRPHVVAPISIDAPKNLLTSTVRVAVVVDFGPHSHLTPKVISKCVRVPTNSNASLVLNQFTIAERVRLTTYANSGLLCSIAGYPKVGCGTAVGSSYNYWSYWHGGKKWSYATSGPATWTVTNGDVEGWRFQFAGGNGPKNAPPMLSSRFAAICALGTVGPTGLFASGPRPSYVPVALVGIGVIILAVASRRRWRPPANT